MTSCVVFGSGNKFGCEWRIYSDKSDVKNAEYQVMVSVAERSSIGRSGVFRWRHTLGGSTWLVGRKGKIVPAIKGD